VLTDLLRRSAAASCLVAGWLTARAELLPGLTVLAEVRFSGGVLPPNWTVNGPPWRIDDGAHAFGHGGYGSILHFQRGPSGDSTLDREAILAQVRMDAPESGFAVCTLGTYGTIAEVDGRTQRIQFYQSWRPGTQPQPFRSAPIPFPLRAGGAYEVLLEKALLPRGDGAETCYSFTLKDLRGSGSVSLTEPFDGDAAGWPGHCWGSPGVMARGGPITVLAFAWGTPFPRRPRLWIGGDSFVEGDSIYARKDRRFAELLYRELGGNAVITGAGGETSGQLAARLDMDLEPFAPEYCLVLIGANDRDFETWRRDLGRIISRIQGKGAVPILGTLAPRASRQAFLDRANAWMLSSGLRIVDFAKALTVAGDRQTWNPALARGDGVHPNLSGHAAMIEALHRDAPYLFIAAGR